MVPAHPYGACEKNATYGRNRPTRRAGARGLGVERSAFGVPVFSLNAQRHTPNDGFYKGLIQLAGAFVHLQKDRLRPAASLFRLAQKYLAFICSSPSRGPSVRPVVKARD